MGVGKEGVGFLSLPKLSRHLYHLQRMRLAPSHRVANSDPGFTRPMPSGVSVRQSARQCARPARALKILVAARFIEVSVSPAAPMS